MTRPLMSRAVTSPAAASEEARRITGTVSASAPLTGGFNPISGLAVSA